MHQGKTYLIIIPLDPRNTKKTVIRNYINFVYALEFTYAGLYSKINNLG